MLLHNSIHIPSVYIVMLLLIHIYIFALKLLDTLLIGCQDKDESIRLCYGECLGELGAIEPSLLPRRIISRGNVLIFCIFMRPHCSSQYFFLSLVFEIIWKFVFAITDDSKFISDMNEEFACALLSEHVRAFQMQKDSQSMDCFSLAIQVYTILCGE